MVDQKNQDQYVTYYIAQLNSELSTKTLECLSLKAQLQLANDKINELIEAQPTVNTDVKKK
jgi:hypothetical protein